MHVKPCGYWEGTGEQEAASRLSGSDMHNPMKNMVDNPVFAHHIYLARPAVPRRLRPVAGIRTRRVASRGYDPAVRHSVRACGAVLGGTFEKGGRLR